MQKNCGFRLMKSVSLEAELEIDLPVPWAAREMPQPLRDLSFGGLSVIKTQSALRGHCGRNEEVRVRL
jgi:hypothetical protein